MYVLNKSKNILTLVTIGYIVGFIVSMYIEYCLWAQVAVLNHKLLYWIVWDRFMQVLYLGRAPRTKETLPDFREKCRVTRHSRVFRGLTGSQRTPGIWGVTITNHCFKSHACLSVAFLRLGKVVPTRRATPHLGRPKSPHSLSSSSPRHACPRLGGPLCLGEPSLRLGKDPIFRGKIHTFAKPI